MKRIMTLAAAATVAATSAFAAEHMTEEMTMLSGKLADALENCNIEADEEAMMELTMAQVSGIVLSASSADGSTQCQDIEAIFQSSDSM